MQPERRGCGRGPKLVTVTRATVKAGRRAGCGLVNTQRTEFANVLNLVGRLEHKPQSNHGSPHSHPPSPHFANGIPPCTLLIFLPRFIRGSVGIKGGRKGEEETGCDPRWSLLIDRWSWSLQVEIFRIFWIFFSKFDLWGLDFLEIFFGFGIWNLEKGVWGKVVV